METNQYGGVLVYASFILTSFIAIITTGSWAGVYHSNENKNRNSIRRKGIQVTKRRYLSNNSRGGRKGSRRINSTNSRATRPCKNKIMSNNSNTTFDYGLINNFNNFELSEIPTAWGEL